MSAPVRQWQTVDVTTTRHSCPAPFEGVLATCATCHVSDVHFMWPGHVVGVEGCVHVRRLCRNCGANFFQATGLTTAKG